MPVPWSPGRSAVRIPNVEDRAMTVNQLRALRLFLRRLCKMRLLRHTGHFSKSAGLHGKAIEWFELNMYDITAEVITKVIPYLDPEEEKQLGNPTRRWYSWAELVAPGPQTAAIMVSHWWGGRFRDFMEVIDKLVIDKSLSISTCIWVCTFANCQFGEDFGAQIAACPFLRALAVAKLTVLIIDRDAGSLKRIWCSLELQYTTAHEKSLELYTPSGRVGAPGSSSGPLVEAVKNWDIRQGEAAEPSYRRQILNYIAGVDETKGLLVKDGTLVLEEGRPSLDDDAVDMKAYPRSSGDPEFAYEAALFQEHGRAFEFLNMAVRTEVMLSVGRAPRPKGCGVQDLCLRGVTLGQLRTFVRRLKETRATWSPGMAWGEITTDHVVKRYIMTPGVTGTRQCSYMELIADDVQKPKYTIWHSRSQKFQETVASIEWFAEALRLVDSTVLFWDILSANQYTRDAEKCGPNGVANIFNMMNECEGIVQCLVDDMASIARLWRLTALQYAVQYGIHIYLSCSQGILACSHCFPEGGWMFGRFNANIARILRSVDVIGSECKVDADRQEMMKMFADTESTTRFTNRLVCWTAGPILSTAAQLGDLQEIAALSGYPGLWLNSDALKGSCGETALHIAAGAGNAEALQALLLARMDPNIEDTIRERPLHYAAMAGHVGIVHLLLGADADPFAESVFGETALQVAGQNPAGFLGVFTSEVAGVLGELAIPCRRGSKIVRGSSLRAIQELSI